MGTAPMCLCLSQPLVAGQCEPHLPTALLQGRLWEATFFRHRLMGQFCRSAQLCAELSSKLGEPWGRSHVMHMPQDHGTLKKQQRAEPPWRWRGDLTRSESPDSSAIYRQCTHFYLTLKFCARLWSGESSPQDMRLTDPEGGHVWQFSKPAPSLSNLNLSCKISQRV